MQMSTHNPETFGNSPQKYNKHQINFYASAQNKDKIAA